MTQWALKKEQARNERLEAENKELKAQLKLANLMKLDLLSLVRGVNKIGLSSDNIGKSQS